MSSLLLTGDSTPVLLSVGGMYIHKYVIVYNNYNECAYIKGYVCSMYMLRTFIFGVAYISTAQHTQGIGIPHNSQCPTN